MIYAQYFGHMTTKYSRPTSAMKWVEMEITSRYPVKRKKLGALLCCFVVDGLLARLGNIRSV